MRPLPSYLEQQAALHRLNQARQKTAAKQAEQSAELIADPVAWIRANFYIPETNAPIALYPSQAAPLAEALRTDADGNFVYSTVLWSAIKKSAKSSIAAAVGMWFAWRKPFSSIKVLGNDLKQAESRTYEYMRRAVLLRPDWRDSIRVNNYKMYLPNNSVIEAIPVDPTGEAGGNDDLVLYTELWGWKSQKHQQMWTESTLSPTKYGKSMRWCESYAGYSGESPILEQLYEAAVKGGRVLDAEQEMYADEPARLFALWNTKPNLPWQTPQYYAQEAASLTPTEFARVHRNEWGTSTAPFVPIEWWDGCKGELPPVGPYQSMVVAMDAATTNDCFGIVAVTRTGEQVEVRHARKWTPPSGGRLDFSNPADPDDFNTPEGYIRWLARTYNVVEVCYDPYQLHDLASRLRREGVAHFREFAQGQPRLVADKQLYDLLGERRILHDGTHADLREHVQNANRKDDGDKLRIIKRAEAMKIDLCVALSMASSEAKRLNIG